ncbi:MAG: UDP-2,4-diacetamido-2,4,6-trideoxy-beta-L-altropyranose hydrolase [Nitrospirota bacterium]|nr:UDP-2,4-diacetamido-2,4,6-trideoxy-beta-L-altropyranose hydrolase [Nitrospirota bacterium]
MKFVFRTDAALMIGTGHVMRCLALADRLREEGHQVHFIFREHPGNLCDWVERERSYPVSRLPGIDGFQEEARQEGHAHWLGASVAMDAEQTVGAIREMAVRPDWLIVDHYAIDANWERVLRPHVERIMVIDDLADRHHDCDLLLDQTFGRLPGDYQALAPSAHTMTGSAYALLRPEFNQVRTTSLARRRSRKGVARILVGMGALDPDNVTKTVLEAIALSGFQWTVDVILAHGAPHLEVVRHWCEESSLDVAVHVSPGNIPELMAHADIGIGAAGTTSWERCCMGLPSMTLVIAENQMLVAGIMERAGAAVNLGNFRSVDPEHIATSLRNLAEDPERLTRMSLEAARMCDGLGTGRVGQRLVPEFATDKNPVWVRPARTEDIQRVFEWQSTPGMRTHCRNPSVPSFDEHVSWFKSRLSDPSCLLNIVIHKRQPAGVLRLDSLEGEENRDVYEVSLLVAPDHQRQGVGGAAIRCARRLVPYAEIKAEILDQNTGSRMLFEREGYLLGKDGLWVQNPVAETAG